MIRINKQNFLNELSGLLTFMSEEDRLEALTLYEKMFDDTDDEQALIHALRSPTRQAVVIARAYDASARKLRSHVRGRKEDEEEESTPEFVLAILKVYEDCVPLPESVPAPMLPQDEEETPEEPLVITGQSSIFDELSPDGEEDAEEEAKPEETETGEESATSEETAEPAAEEDGEEKEELLILKPDEREEPTDTTRLPIEPEDDEDEEDEDEDDEDEEDEDGAYVKQAKAPLLILFVLLAIPLTLLGVALLLIPTAVSLALAAGMIAAGCAGILAAFGGFAILADILVVLGCSIIALALGLLFLWLFVWFIGGAIVGLIRAVIQLGKAWCYEEVPA